MDNTEPIGKIEPQILDSLPIPAGTTLVDDPVALVDDPNTLTGSQTTQIKALGETTDSNAPKVFIKMRR